MYGRMFHTDEITRLVREGEDHAWIFAENVRTEHSYEGSKCTALRLKG